MQGLRVFAVSAVLAAAVLALPTAAVASPAGAMTQRINLARQAHGLRPLRASRSLNRSAARFARQLMQRAQLRHAATIHASRRFHRLGEILALHEDWRPRSAATLRDWLRSPPHRLVLLRPYFRYVGVARVRGRFHRRPATIWVAQFGVY